MTPPEPAPESASPDVPLPSAAATLRPAIRMTAGPWAWLLRAAALASFLAAVTGVLVAPGLRGLAADRIVDASNRLAWTFAYFMFGLLVAAIILAALQLSRGARARNLGNGIAVSIAGLTMALAAPALVRPLPTVMAAILAVVASLAAIVGGLRGLRAKHTRAVAALMLSFAMAALLRIFAWDLARMAGDNGNTSLYATARGVATAALLLEAIGQMIAAAWLGTRSRFGGQFLSSIAVALAWVLTYGAALGASANAKPWEAAAHIALATATGLPRPYGPNGLGVFLLAASISAGGGGRRAAWADRGGPRGPEPLAHRARHVRRPDPCPRGDGRCALADARRDRRAGDVAVAPRPARREPEDGRRTGSAHLRGREALLPLAGPGVRLYVSPRDASRLATPRPSTMVRPREPFRRVAPGRVIGSGSGRRRAILP